MTKELSRKPRSPRSGSKESTIFEKYFSFQIVIGVVIVLAAIYVAIKANLAGIKNMISADYEVIKAAMTGDVPYLFYCNRGGKEDIYPIIFTEANTKLGSKFGFASLNCSKVLPSGKSIFDRFKLETSWRPCIFSTAPWFGSKAIQATPNHMRDSKSFTAFIEKHLYPKAREIGTDSELKKVCGFSKPKDPEAEPTSEMSSIKNTCIVIVTGGRYSKTHADLEERMIRHVPRAKIVKLDGSKKRLSMEDVEAFPADSFAMKIYTLREGTHYLEMTNPVTWDYLNTFLSYSFATPLNAYSTLDNGKAISILKIASIFKDRTNRQNNAGNSKKEKKPASGSKKANVKKSSSSSQKHKADEEETRSETDTDSGSYNTDSDDGDDEEEVIEL